MPVSLLSLLFHLGASRVWRSANAMALASLALQTVLLIAEMIVGLLLLRPHCSSSSMMLYTILQLLHIQFRKLLHCHLEICNQGITSAPGEVLTDDNAHHLDFIRIGCHRVRRNHPTSLSQVVCDGKLIKLVSVFWIEAESHQWKTLALSLRHEKEAHLLHSSCQVVCRPGQIEHDAPITLFAETNHLIVLSNHIRSTAREVEGEGSLVGTQVVDVEDEFLWQELGITPDDPSSL